MCASSWFLMSVIVHHTRGWKVPPCFYGKWRWVPWFSRIWNTFAQMFVFGVLRFSKSKSLYLNECEKCYGRQIYAFNAHNVLKKCVVHTSQYLKIIDRKCLVTLMNSFQRWGLSCALGGKIAEYVFGFMKFMWHQPKICLDHVPAMPHLSDIAAMTDSLFTPRLSDNIFHKFGVHIFIFH
jgi:hypothetical protein